MGAFRVTRNYNELVAKVDRISFACKNQQFLTGHACYTQIVVIIVALLKKILPKITSFFRNLHLHVFHTGLDTVIRRQISKQSLNLHSY